MGRQLNRLVSKSAFTKHTPSDHWPLADQLIGLEIELEGTSAVERDRHDSNGNPFWARHQDDSLRGGTEYVLAQPMMGEQLSEAISYFFGNFKKLGKSSARASTHVHINMLQESDTVEVLQNMTAIYYALEDSIYTNIDESRKWAVYAAPLSARFPREVSVLFTENFTADQWLASMEMNADNGGRQARYFGYNMKAMSRYGSIEFRHFPAVTNEKQLRDWVFLVMELKAAALELDLMGIAAVNHFVTKESFDILLTLMPTWGKRLLSNLDRECGLIKMQAIYNLMPIKKLTDDRNQGLTNSAITMWDGNPIFAKLAEVGVKTPQKKPAGPSTPPDLQRRIDAIARNATRAGSNLPRQGFASVDSSWNATRFVEEDSQLEAQTESILQDFTRGEVFNTAIQAQSDAGGGWLQQERDRLFRVVRQNQETWQASGFPVLDTDEPTNL